MLYIWKSPVSSMKINIFVKVSKKSFTMGWCGVVRLSVRLSVLAWLFFWEHLEFRNLANVSLGTLPGGFFQKNFKNLKMGFLFFFLKIQDDHGRSKVHNQPNFAPQITFFAIIWIRFIGFTFLNLFGLFKIALALNLFKIYFIMLSIVGIQILLQ